VLDAGCNALALGAAYGVRSGGTKYDASPHTSSINSPSDQVTTDATGASISWRATLTELCPRTAVVSVGRLSCESDPDIRKVLRSEVQPIRDLSGGLRLV
jgi:hypothetical protein